MAVPAHDERDFAFAKKIRPTDRGGRVRKGRLARHLGGSVHGGRHCRAFRAARWPADEACQRGDLGPPRAIPASAGARVNYKLRGLGLFETALLGRTDPHLFPRAHRRRPQARRRLRHRLLDAHPGRRSGIAPAFARTRGLSARGSGRRRSWKALDWRLLPEGRQVVRSGDEHHAAVGRQLLVLLALPRPAQRRRDLQSESVRRLDAGRPLRRRQ